MSSDLPGYYSEFGFPETDLAIESFRFAEKAEQEFIFHHSLRAYIYGKVAADQRGLKAGRDYDDELLFVCCVLHDLGLTEQGNGDQRFEVDGADVAAEWLRARGIDEKRVGVVWDAIALHTTEGVAQRKGPEIALTQAGTGTDMLGWGKEDLPAGLVERVHAVLPRADISFALTDAIVGQAMEKPSKASPLNFPGLLLRRHLPLGTMPDWHDLIAQTGWGDRPSALRSGETVATTPEQLGELFSQRLAEGDLEGLAALYEPTATFVPQPGNVVSGAGEIRANLEGYIKSGARVELKVKKIHTVGDIAVLSCDGSATGLGPDGQTLNTTTTEVARRQPDGRWLYLVDDPFFGAEV
ncbi:DUF4440 domain-containing protein [Nocardia cyriacigeorgica]|uniref:nuclear transport factor 2 family protein n=1 Tax=Nocardia cyriacigeorgica TaxID=135487 RepID=UPI001895D3DD|nr:nuclear transport factor 2 family protein [Nocardia cyriacigeorgica]MBF6397458.1 DUF4440 domain-containing protein [Nocardia cyriacigeorgica]MBF6402884.1 DUF4440 domain-containing protein [Nocardia cyriacigeorgica]